MIQSNQRKKRYLILPDSGIMGQTLTETVFRDSAMSTGSKLTETLFAQVEQYSGEGETAAAFAAPAATAELAEAIGESDFTLVAQSFDDGPAVVKMTEAARMAIEASHPGLRVFPITRYRLPGDPGPRAKPARAAALPAAVSAVQADGSVFMADAKQHFLDRTDPGEAGKEVLVAVLDTGVDGAHPALQGRIAVSRCLIPGAGTDVGRPVNWGPANAKFSGHGTHVAGIVAGRSEQGGPPGVAPEARIADYRIFPDNPGRRAAAENAVIIDSIRAAIEDGCHIINLSIEGSSLKEDGVRSAIADAWSQGVVCIAAAGNGFFKPVSYPAALPHCVAVTAIGREGCFPATADFRRHASNQRAASDDTIFLASFSNFGPRVQFTAPGHAIVSTFPNGEWWFDSGTSMAAPFVAGMLARLLSNNSNIRNALGDAQRSAAMVQMLIGRARMLGLPQVSQEGYGLPS